MFVTQIKLPNTANFLQSACDVVKSKTFQVSFGAAFAFTAIWVICSPKERPGAQLENLGYKIDSQLSSSVKATLQFSQPILPIPLLQGQPESYLNLTNSNLSIKPVEEALLFESFLQGSNIKLDQTSLNSTEVQKGTHDKNGIEFLGRVFMKNKNFCPALNLSAAEGFKSTNSQLRAKKIASNVGKHKISGISWSNWAWGVGGICVGGVLTYKAIKQITSSAALMFSESLFKLVFSNFF